MRYAWKKGSDVMHIQKFTRYGEALNKTLCGRVGYSRTINAPWKLGKKLCGSCEMYYDRERSREFG